jgi:hypothetical protein
LVTENTGWAESIARSVARAWSLDWRDDGLDGAALEALLFCARRFQPSRGVPFRGYARKRIHEAASDAARKSKGWRRGSSPGDAKSREVSAALLALYPDLRAGELPVAGEDGGDGEDLGRTAIRQLLVSATLIATRQTDTESSAEEIMDQRKMVTFMGDLDLVHRILLWKIYWEGISMRNLAEEWETDELNVIREHKNLLHFLVRSFGKGRPPPIPKVRPGLKPIQERLQRDQPNLRGPFREQMNEAR